MRTPAPPLIDGHLSDNAWRATHVMEGFTQKFPLEGVAPSERTTFRVLYDDEALYVISYAIAPDLIVDAAPEYVVLLEVYGRNGLLRDERFLAAYALDSKLETDIYGSDGLLVYRRRP